MDGTLAEIRLFAGTFNPRNWSFCQGQLLPISTNQALFSLLGTYYGGDGRTTFGLPDLRGRTAMGTGIGPGLTPRNLGNLVGSEIQALSLASMPAHTHTSTWTQTSGSGTGTASGPVSVDITPVALNDEGDQVNPLNNVPAKFTPGSGDAYGEFDASSPGDYVNMHTLQGTGTVNAPVVLSSVDVTGVVTINNTGNGSPFSIVQPGLAMNYIICIEGLYPSRN